jgi:hypothetical protein
MLSLTRSVDECHIKKDFLYFLNYLWKCSVNAKCREDDRAAFLKGILVGVAIKNAVDALNDALDEADITDEEMRVAREIERLQGLDREGQ